MLKTCKYKAFIILNKVYCLEEQKFLFLQCIPLLSFLILEITSLCSILISSAGRNQMESVEVSVLAVAAILRILKWGLYSAHSSSLGLLNHSV